MRLEFINNCSTILAVLSCLIFLNCSENKKVKYEDFDEKDFIEVQGIITKTVGRKTFQNRASNDIYFIYYLNNEKPFVGYELQSPYILDNGEPVIVLVHKNNKNISFFGARGIIDEEGLLTYLRKCEEIGGGYFGVDEKYVN